MATPKEHELAKKILKIMEDGGLDYDQQLEVILLTRKRLELRNEM